MDVPIPQLFLNETALEIYTYLLDTYLLSNSRQIGPSNPVQREHNIGDKAQDGVEYRLDVRQWEAGCYWDVRLHIEIEAQSEDLREQVSGEGWQELHSNTVRGPGSLATGEQVCQPPNFLRVSTQYNSCLFGPSRYIS